MANKERGKRAARKARQEERARLEELHKQSGYVAPEDAPKKSKLSVLKKDDKDEKAPAASKASKKEPAKKQGRIRTYFKGVRSEMKQVTWTPREELRNYSVAVIATLLVFGLCEWVVDNGFVALIVALSGLRG